MRFYDLGPLRVEVEGTTTPLSGRLAAVLATLLLHRDRRVAVDLLLDAVWGDAATDRSVRTLETHVWRLRRLLEPNRVPGEAASVLLNDTGGYRLVATTGQVDSARFEQLSLDVLDRLTTVQPARALQAADEALALWRGDPFEALRERSWASGPIARLVETRTALQERRVDALLGVGRADVAVAELEPLLVEHPFRERLWGQRMLALYRAGRSEDALETYRSARRALLDEVGLEPGPELVELQRRILHSDPDLRLSARPSDVAPVRTVELRLPRPRPMLGRDTELAALSDLIGSTRLVTVAGTAGCGKTLLAVEAARTVAARFPEGVWFVDLSAAEADSDVAALVSATLELAVPENVDAAAVLTEYATDRQSLLVLDNCEQILDQVAKVAEPLSDPGRQTRVLATSREPMGLVGEAVFALKPLVLRETAAENTTAEDEPAVALFRASARLTQDGPAQDLTAIRRICRAVDGIPLAIELAAALASTFSLEEVAEQVERNPDQLAAVGRGQARHHQTLTTAIERSHRLLSPEEQVLHRRLAVVPGSFGRELAAAVAGPGLEANVTGQLARLVHRSLLTTTREDGHTRFAQLAPIRGHALHVLHARGELPLAERLRDGWVEALVLARPRAGRPEEAYWYGLLRSDLPTVRATLHRQLVAEPGPAGAAIANELLGFWYFADLLEEGVRWAEAALDQASEAELDGVNARLSLAALLAMRSRADRSGALTVQALDLVEADGVAGLRLSGHPHALPEEDQLRLAERLIGVASAFSVVRNAELMRRPLDLVERAGLLATDLDLQLTHAAVSCLLEVVEGPTEATLARAGSVFERATAHGNLSAEWLAASSASSIALQRRDPELGRTWSRRVIDQQGRLGARTVMPQVETYGDFLALDGRLVEAVRVFAATYQQARRVGHPWPRNAVTTELLERCQTALSTADFNAAWAVGPTFNRQQLVG